MQQETDGNLQPKQRGKPQFSYLTNTELELRELIVENHKAISTGTVFVPMHWGKLCVDDAEDNTLVYL